MPDSTATRRDDRPTEGFATARLPAHPDRPARLFLPSDYQPKYAYPLVVLFHPDGADEDAAARLAPQLSRRNYVTVCPRGPVALGPGAAGRRGFGWGSGADDAYLLAAVAHARRSYHVHSGRVYLVGIGAGATAAFRLGQILAGDGGGVIALNGPPLPHRAEVRGVRVFVGHGANNPAVPAAAARRAARRLSAAGTEVRFATYPAAHGVHPDMLRDANRWIMGAVNTTPELFAAHEG